MIKNLLIAIFLLLNFSVFSQTWVHNPDWWMPNGYIDVIEPDTANNVVYIGGLFTAVGPPVHNSAVLDSTGFPLLNYDMPNGEVHASIAGSDSSWIIGGLFDQVGECSRLGLAEIDANGKLTELFKDIGFNRTINSLQIRDSLVYVAGNFTSVGKFKKYAAFFEVGENQPDYAKPQPNGEVNSILDIPGGGWYVGGGYSMYGDSVRASLVSLDPSGNPSNWHPLINGTIHAMLIVGDTLFIGGDFTQVDGQVRTNLAAFNRLSGQLLAWNPTANSWVLTMSTYGNRIIIGGYFSQVNGNLRQGLASINKTNGILEVWNPNPNYSIYATFIDGSTLYVGGEFSQIAGQSRNNIAVFDLTTNSLKSWNPNANSPVWALEVSSDKIYIGGEFTVISGQARQKIAEFNKSTNTLTNWNPNVQSTVSFIKRSSNNVYIGGNFWQVDSQIRKCVAAFDMTSGTLLNWAPNTDNDQGVSPFSINAISLQYGKIFIGGDAPMIGGMHQPYIVSINSNTGKIANNQIQLDNAVNKIIVRDSMLYLAGNFSQINGLTRSKLAEYDLNNNLTTNFNPNINSTVNSICLQNDSMFVGGFFTSVNGQSRVKFAAFNVVTGTLLNWNPTTNGSVDALFVKENRVYVGGSFSMINGLPSQNFIILSATDGSIISSPGTVVDGSVATIEGYGDSILIGGSFGLVNNIVRSNFAIIDGISEVVLPMSPNPTNVLFTISLNGPKLFVGGSFSSIGTVGRKNLAAFNMTTGAVTDWNPEAIGSIRSIKAYGDNVHVSGSITSVNGTPKNGFAQINRITSLLTPFDLNQQGFIHEMKIKDSFLIVCGDFNSILGSPRNHVAFINLNTSTLTNWDPQLGVNGYVNSGEIIGTTIYLGGLVNIQTIPSSYPQLVGCDLNTGITTASYDLIGEISELKSIGDSLYILGDFTYINGIQRNGFTGLDVINGIILPFNPDPNNSVFAIHTSENNLYAGGGFSNFMQQPRKGLAEIDVTNELLSNFNPLKNGDVNALNSANNLLFAGTGYNLFSVETNLERKLAVFEKCNLPIDIVLAASSMNICLGDSVELSLVSGNLNDATEWVWYADEVGCNSIGQGTNITVYPSESITYLLRGEGACSRHQKGIEIKIIVDEDAPIISICPSNQIIPYNLPNCSASATWIPPTAIDNCSSSLTIFESNQPNEIFPQGDNIITYTFTDTSGNSASCAFTISVLSTIDVSGTIVNSNCYGSATGSIDVTPIGGLGSYGYNWNNGTYISQDLSAISAGIYTLIVTDADQCQIQQIFEVIEPAPLNTNVVVTGNMMVSTNTSAGVSYEWLDCNDDFAPIVGENNQNFQVLQNGTYAVNITINGCSIIGECYSFNSVELPTNDAENVVNIYPNPSTGVIYINELEPFTEVIILDMYGRELQKLQIDQQHKIDLSNECDGVYIICFEFMSESRISKIILLNN